MMHWLVDFGVALWAWKQAGGDEALEGVLLWLAGR